MSRVSTFGLPWTQSGLSSFGSIVGWLAYQHYALETPRPGGVAGAGGATEAAAGSAGASGSDSTITGTGISVTARGAGGGSGGAVPSGDAQSYVQGGHPVRVMYTSLVTSGDLPWGDAGRGGHGVERDRREFRNRGRVCILVGHRVLDVARGGRRQVLVAGRAADLVRPLHDPVRPRLVDPHQPGQPPGLPARGQWRARRQQRVGVQQHAHLALADLEVDPVQDRVRAVADDQPFHLEQAHPASTSSGSSPR